MTPNKTTLSIAPEVAAQLKVLAHHRRTTVATLIEQLAHEESKREGLKLEHEPVVGFYPDDFAQTGMIELTFFDEWKWHLNRDAVCGLADSFKRLKTGGSTRSEMMNLDVTPPIEVTRVGAGAKMTRFSFDPSGKPRAESKTMTMAVVARIVEELHLLAAHA